MVVYNILASNLKACTIQNEAAMLRLNCCFDLIKDGQLVDIMRVRSICTGNTCASVWSENWKTAEQIEEK